MSFKKYPKIKRVGHPDTDEIYADPDHEIIITEKLDGNNFRFTYDSDEDALRFGSRNVDLGANIEEIGGQFEDVTEFIDDRVSVESMQEEIDRLGSDFVVFGENLGFEHLIRDYVEETPTYQMFDVYLVDDNRWLSRPDVVIVAENLGLPVAPVVDRMLVEDFDHTEYEIEPSVWRPASEPPEGVVVENQTTMTRGKILTEDFKEKKQSGYGSDDRERPDNIDNTYKFVNKYVTEARIKKQVHKMQTEEDRELSMEMMEDLHERVWEDAWGEEWRVMIYEDMDINLKEGHSIAANKCASVLQDMIQNRDVSK